MALDATEYLTKERGIHPAVAEYAAWYTDGDRYVIPYFDAQGRERARRFHSPGSKPKYQSESGSQSHIYCVENVRFEQVVVCEGEIDTLSAMSAGIKAIGLPGANVFHRAWVHLLDHVDDLVIAFDGDAAGKDAAARLKGILPHARIEPLPDGMDLNDILQAEGPEFLREGLEV